MSNNIVVAVSPFYTGAGWKDSFTGIEFKPNQFYHPIQISEDQDLTGIKRSLRLNSLIDSLLFSKAKTKSFQYRRIRNNLFTK